MAVTTAWLIPAIPASEVFGNSRKVPNTSLSAIPSMAMAIDAHAKRELKFPYYTALV